MPFCSIVFTIAFLIPWSLTGGSSNRLVITLWEYEVTLVPLLRNGYEAIDVIAGIAMSQTVNQGEAYADGTPLVDLFGEGARARMLSVFATQRDREFNVTELANQAGINRKTAYEHIDDFVDFGIVETREASRGDRYATARESEVSTKLFELNGAMLKRRQEMREDIDTPSE